MAFRNSLVGLFYTRNRGEFYYTGEIIGQVGPETYLLRHDARNGHAGPLELADLGEMMDIDGEGIPCWGLFETRGELQAWINYLDSPSEPNVVSLVKK